MNTNIPDDLMDNVERKLRKHVKNKRKKLHMAAAALIGCGIILPTSVFAYAQYTDSIPYKQEIDLARQHNNITKINKVFKYKNVTFTIKEIVADDTGMEVIYDVSDPRYSINSVKFGDKDGKAFTTWGYTTPNEYLKDNEKAFCITMDKDAINYMHENPVTIQVYTVAFSDGKGSKSLLADLNAFIYGKNSNLKVDWSLKMQVPMQKTKTININKEYALDIGTLKINCLKVGVLKSILDYSFVPKDKSISMVHPMFSIRLGNEYVNGDIGEDFGPGGGMAISNKPGGNVEYGVGENVGYFGTREFESVYYKNLSQIGIKLIAMEVKYKSNNSQVYKIDKNKLPMEINYNGEKIKITSIEEKKDSTNYNVEYEKNNKIYNSVEFDFCQPPSNDSSENNGWREIPKRGKVKFIDQAYRDKVYASLVKEVPNLKDIEKQISIDGESNALEDANISDKITVKHKETSTPTEFKILGADKNLIYDEDEVIINNSYR
ncbi:MULTISPECIES: DUF4179 domain-containing protein [Clostridium]|uniref:DUF4179 domain-containing protein n=1 Tax=Clostridium TaxID=1485 RepID=UPI00069E127C|nr:MULTISPECIES: DUF4179 domain-containing protein [Clostridium]KOF57588.1 hypothetical protein AGR56_14765 [Clostridium sp. DMHC 10]MCD2345636.1 DUF4179 domain-containing protein [Clostridium guangxiense]